MPSPTLPARGARALSWLVCALALGACAPQAAPPRNLLLISIDTLRPDHLGVYGYPRPTSPRLDAFARDAVVFERAYGSSSWTLPSMASLLTSEYPSGHRCVGNRSSLAPGFATLAEHLAAQGFDTAAVVSHVFFARRYGLDQGFAHYDDDLVRDQAEQSERMVSSPAVTAKARAWLEARARAGDARPFFLWIHYFDPHADYLPHPGVTERFGDRPVDLYDGEIAFTDAYVGEVLDALERLGLARDTLVVVVSDHGEAFGERGFHGHRLTLHEEELRVVMMFRVPGLAPRRVATPVSLVDVEPTVLELLGAPPLAQAAGTSLVPALRGASFARAPILAELRSALTWHREDAVIDADWKLIVQRRRTQKLYDLARDPGEARDLGAAEPKQALRLRGEMVALRVAAQRRGGAVEAVPDQPLDPQLQRRLQALGYAEPAPAEEAPPP
jgi:arylsulfatase A-like enzyme